MDLERRRAKGRAYRLRHKHPCPYCGKLIQRESKACRKCNRQGARNNRWKGGRSVNQEGYVLVWFPSHPDADPNGYILEHRLVMAQSLGRPLSSEEVVHHIDGDRSNNLIGNLKLYPSGSEHTAYHKSQRR
jgi:hypothetical protein